MVWSLPLIQACETLTWENSSLRGRARTLESASPALAWMWSHVGSFTFSAELWQVRHVVSSVPPGFLCKSARRLSVLRGVCHRRAAERSSVTTFVKQRENRWTVVKKRIQSRKTLNNSRIWCFYTQRAFFPTLTVLNCSFCNIPQSFILFFLSYLKVLFFPGASLISCSTWFCSPEVFDCMFLHLFTHSCASPCFTVSCLSPEMLHRLPYTLSQKTCFTGGLLDQRKLQIFRSGSRICHGAVYQMMRR